jgi:xanthine dehydrogenase YagR molybdenum-binding subunit
MHAATVLYEPEGVLTVYDKTQGVINTWHYLSMVFALPKKKIRVLSPYVGGAFGSGLRPQKQLFLAVLATLELKRSVKVVLTRQQMFSLGHRPFTLQSWRWERPGTGPCGHPAWRLCRDVPF